MLACPLTSTFMYDFANVPASQLSRYAVFDQEGSWLDLFESSGPAPTGEQLARRGEYALRLGVTFLENLGGKIIKENPLDTRSPETLARSLQTLTEALEFFHTVANLKKMRDVPRQYAWGASAAAQLQELFTKLRQGDMPGVGASLAQVFHTLHLQRVLALKTARNLLSL